MIGWTCTATTVRNILGRLQIAVYDALFVFATEEHWVSWVMSTFKACIADIIRIARTSGEGADDATIDRDIKKVRNAGIDLIRKRVSVAYPKLPPGAVQGNFGRFRLYKLVQPKTTSRFGNGVARGEPGQGVDSLTRRFTR